MKMFDKRNNYIEYDDSNVILDRGHRLYVIRIMHPAIIGAQHADKK